MKFIMAILAITFLVTAPLAALSASSDSSPPATAGSNQQIALVDNLGQHVLTADAESALAADRSIPDISLVTGISTYLDRYERDEQRRPPTPVDNGIVLGYSWRPTRVQLRA